MTRLLIAGLMAAVAVPVLAQAAPPMAPKHERVMTRAEVQGHVAQMFARVDANHDGVITKAETDAAHQAMAAKRQSRQGGHATGKMGAMGAMHHDPAAAFDRIDANHDGTISRAEFVAAHAKREQKMGDMKGMGGMGGIGGMGGMRQMHGGMADRIFEKSDTNHDGRVTQAEAQAEAFAHFDMMDANHDGRVTSDERKAARQMMQHKGR